MSKVYILGGGPGGGKSTLAKMLSKQLGVDYWRADDFVDEHQEAAAREKFPMNQYITSLPEDERPLELIKLTAKQELARQEELFFMMLKELRTKQFDTIVLEGNCLLPALVAERFEYPYQAVWLIPTLAYQKRLYPQRPWAHDILKHSDDPERTLQNWILRDNEYNKTVQKQVQQHGLPYMMIDKEQSVDTVLAWAKKQLAIKSARPATARRV